ncbi:hypothetical protein Vretimale_1953, partial [Volvox reticuliferus]
DLASSTSRSSLSESCSVANSRPASPPAALAVAPTMAVLSPPLSAAAGLVSRRSRCITATVTPQAARRTAAVTTSQTMPARRSIQATVRPVRSSKSSSNV